MTDQIIIYRSPTEQAIGNMVFDLLSSKYGVWVFGLLLLALIAIKIFIEREKRVHKRKR